jgi:hypothetical protein
LKIKLAAYLAIFEEFRLIVKYVFISLSGISAKSTTAI